MVKVWTYRYELDGGTVGGVRTPRFHILLTTSERIINAVRYVMRVVLCFVLHHPIKSPPCFSSVIPDPILSLSPSRFQKGQRVERTARPFPKEAFIRLAVREPGALYIRLPQCSKGEAKCQYRVPWRGRGRTPSETRFSGRSCAAVPLCRVYTGSSFVGCSGRRF